MVEVDSSDCVVTSASVGNIVELNSSGCVAEIESNECGVRPDSVVGVVVTNPDGSEAEASGSVLETDSSGGAAGDSCCDWVTGDCICGVVPGVCTSVVLGSSTAEVVGSLRTVEIPTISCEVVEVLVVPVGSLTNVEEATGRNEDGTMDLLSNPGNRLVSTCKDSVPLLLP